MSQPILYPSLQVEAAICIWEYLIENYANQETKYDDPWVEYRSEHGTVSLRWEVIDVIAPWVLSVYDAGKLVDPNIWDCLSYDWEVIPAIMSAVKFDGLDMILPKPEDALLTAALKIGFQTPSPLVANPTIDADAAFLIALCGETL